MAARRMMLPDYGTVSMKGTQYYRTRVTDQQGRRVSLYARTREELYQKEQEAIQQIENKTYCRSTPTVEEYCEKWLDDVVLHFRCIVNQRCHPDLCRLHHQAIGRYAYGRCNSR